MLVVDFQDRERDGVVHLLRRGGGGGVIRSRVYTGIKTQIVPRK